MRKYYKVSLAAFCLLILILDCKTAMIGAKEGILLCLNSVIPSLLPMLIISIYLTGMLGKLNFSFLAPVTQKLGIPVGLEGILPICYLAGYPIGAQTVSQAYNRKQISKQTAENLLTFCNNSGPSFIFGVSSVLFRREICIWMIWAIHILSSIITGVILSNKTHHLCIEKQSPSSISLPKAVRNSAETISQICIWVILFRVFIAILDRWVLWICPRIIRVIIIGILELTNGCIEIAGISNPGIQFLLCSFFLAFGGICVGMQTVSVISPLSIRSYIVGKLLQSAISIVLSYIAMLFLFHENQASLLPKILLPIVCIISLIIVMFKKRVAKTDKMLYNV